MRLQEFRLLAKERQIDVIKDKGAYLSIRQEEETDIILYQLEGFYVEVLFDGHQLQGPKIKCFDIDESLDIYLEQVNIDEVQYLLKA
jgi:hypothetical protein